MTSETLELREICNLSDEDLETRRALMAEQLFAFVRKREELANGLFLYFDETPERRAQLDEFVAFERVCCSSIDWTVRSVAGSLRLEINGIDPKSAAFASVGSDLVESPASENPLQWARLFRSIGFGSLGALMVCCVLPLAVAALIGATSLLILDNPWVILGSAIGLGGLLWHWEGHRLAKRNLAQSAPSCGC